MIRKAANRRNVRRKPGPRADIRAVRYSAMVLAIVLVLALCISPAATVQQIRLRRPLLSLAHERRGVENTLHMNPGQPLVRLDRKGIERTLEALPWVRRAAVTLTGRSVVASVIPRRSAYTLRCSSGQFEVDDDGYVIRPKRVGIRLPEVAVDGRVRLSVGDRIRDKRLLGGMTAAMLAERVECLRGATVSVDRNAGICFNNWDRVTVVIGDVEDLPRKLAVVRAIYAARSDIGVTVSEINVAHPRMPAGRPRQQSGDRPADRRGV